MTRFILLGGIALFALAAGASFAQPPRQSADAAGRRLYRETGCAACHGLVGQGSAAGPRLAAKATSSEAFARQVRQPVADMPAYSEKVLSRSQLAAIEAFVRTIRAPPPADDVPLLRNYSARPGGDTRR